MPVWDQSSRNPTRWAVLTAIALHAAMLSFGWLTRSPMAPLPVGARTSPSLSENAEFEIELLDEHADTKAMKASASKFPTATRAPIGAPPRSSPGTRPSGGHTAEAGKATTSRQTTRVPQLAMGDASRDVEGSLETSHQAESPSEDNASANRTPDWLRRDPASADPRGNLNDLLGLDSAALREGPAPPTEMTATEAAEDRLVRSIAQGQVERERKIGVSRHGYVATAVNQAAQGLAPPRSTAKFLVGIDSAGNVTHFAATEANRDLLQWQKVADRARRALKGRKLSTGTGRPIRLVLKTTSDVQLPSGRAPGTGLSVLGYDVVKKGHKNSGGVALLSPKVEFKPVGEPDPTRNGEPRRTPELSVRFSIIELNSDLVDIGATGRQVVHTKLLSQQVL